MTRIYVGKDHRPRTAAARRDARVTRCGGCGGWLASESMPCATCRQRVRQQLLVQLAGLDEDSTYAERALCHDVYNDTLDEQQLLDELSRLRLAQ